MKFPRQARLSGAEAFGAVFARPRVSRDTYFRVLSKRNDQAINRLGMAVSRRVCARAVGRNRLKRLIRESFREHKLGNNEATMRDFVVLPSPAAVAISNTELFHSLAEHWRRHRRPENDQPRPDRNDAKRHESAKGN